MGVTNNAGGNFFVNFFASLFGGRDANSEKKRKLKAIAKRLSKSHYHFYKAGSAEVLPAFPKFFYELYKAISPAQFLFQTIQNEAAVKRSFVEYFLSDKQKELLAFLSPESIEGMAHDANSNEVAKKAKTALESFLSEFTADKTLLIENQYKNYDAFKSFCTYDYYFMLKKFDSSLVEANFTKPTKFEKIEGKYIVEELKDFIAVMANVTLQTIDWSSLFKIFKDLRGTDLINPNVWKKIVSRLQNLQNTKTLPLMVSLISENPLYEENRNDIHVNLVEPFINKLKVEIASSIQKLQTAEKNSKASDILQKLFGEAELSYLTNYTKEASANLEKKHLHGFTYCDALNYLKAFLLEFVKKDIREYCELVLVRGKWSETRLSSPMSNAYNDLLSASDAITSFDKSLEEEGAIGMKIKTLMPQIGHNADSASVINRLVGDANADAKNFILETTRNIITIGKFAKSLLEDEQNKTGELIINWKELEHFSEVPPSQMASDAYKRIYLFTTLMKTCLLA